MLKIIFSIPRHRNLLSSIEGLVFTMVTEAIKKFCNEKSKFDVNVTIRNLKEEAKDDDEESGVSNGSGTD